MKILLMPASYPPQLGGVEVAVSNLVHQLKLRGHQVTVVTSSSSFTFGKETDPSGVVIYRLPFALPNITIRAGFKEAIRHLLRSFAALVSAPISLFTFLKILKSAKPDIVNVHYIYENAFFCLIAKKTMKFKLIVNTHGSDIEGHSNRSRAGRWLVEHTLALSDRVLSNSAHQLAIAEQICPLVKTKSAVVGNGVNVEEFASAPEFKHGKPYILCVARFAPEKGQDILLKAFQRVHQRNPELDLIMVGTGLEKERCLLLAKELGISGWVTFLGSLEPCRIPSLVSGCKMFVLPSRREAFGIVVLEAMAAKKPVIATRVGGLPEIITNMENGLLVEPDSPERLAGAIEMLLDNPQLCQSLAEKGYQTVKESYTWEKVAERYLAQYQLVLDEVS